MTNSYKLLASFALGAALCAGSHAAYYSHYDVTLNLGKPVTNLFLLETDGGSGLRDIWSFNADGNGTTHMDVFFPSDAPIASSLFIGLTQGLPSDDNPEQKHIVLFMDDTAASLSNHIAWGTLFRNTDEDALIQHLLDATSGDEQVIDDGIIHLQDFALGDAKTGILGPGGQSRSAWFNMGGSFTAMTWSDGQVIGTGNSNLTPEPCSMAVMGLGVLALIRRRKI